MKIRHKFTGGWLPPGARLDPEWDVRIEREAQRATSAAERSYAKAEHGLARAEARLAVASQRQGASRKRLAQLAREVDDRRQELLALAKVMRSHGSPSTARGTKSHRGVNVSEPM